MISLVALSSACSDTGTAHDAWITTDRDGARVIEARLGAQGRTELSAVAGQDLVALRLPRSDLALASSAIHQELHRCAGFKLRSSSQDPGVARPGGAGALQVAYAIDNAATVTPLLAEVQVSNLLATIQTLSAFPTRFHDSDDGLAAALWLRDLWQGYANGRADVSVELIAHEETPQPSVALTITGATQPTELVILGGHLDSINVQGEDLAPGADDNASGIAVLSEIARAALELGYRPDRSVVFYGYAAEEVGLVGSEEIAAQAEASGLDVVGVVQFDMTNYNPAPEPYLALITDYTDPTLNELAKQLIEEYVDMPWQESECGYGCSDHASWFEHGFPVHYVHESNTDESNEFIHTAEDTLALSDGKADHSLHFARYGAAFMAEVAKGTIPPESECDAGRPCPANATCQQGVCVTSAGGSGGSAATAGASGGGIGGSVGGGGAAGAGGLGGSVAPSGGMPAAMDPAAVSQPASTRHVADACSCRAPGKAGDAGSGYWLLFAVAYWRVLRKSRVLSALRISRTRWGLASAQLRCSVGSSARS